MTKRFKHVLVVTLMVAGILSFGEGTRIYLKAILAQILLQNAWSQTRSGETNVKPWPWAEMYPIARLQVPAHDEDIIVLAGTTGKSLAFGPGYVTSSASPGEADNMVIAGHRDTHFAFLEHLEMGQERLPNIPDHLKYFGQCFVIHLDFLHFL